MTDAEKALIEISRSIGGIESNIKDIRHCLFGNGQPGLAGRFETLMGQHVQCLEDRSKMCKTVANIEKELQVKKAVSNYITWSNKQKMAIAGIIVSGGGAIGVELFKMFFKK
jgi:hypothetical protein